MPPYTLRQSFMQHGSFPGAGPLLPRTWAKALGLNPLAQALSEQQQGIRSTLRSSWGF